MSHYDSWETPETWISGGYGWMGAKMFAYTVNIPKDTAYNSKGKKNCV